MNNFFRIIFLFLFLVCLNKPADAQCKVSKVVENGKIKIDPAYLYDGFTLTNFTMNDKAKRMQVQFTALRGQHYKLYFSNSGFPEDVKISVFKEEKDGKLSADLLGQKDFKDKVIEFEIIKSGSYTINYEIPVCENAEYGMTKNECIVMLISYQEK
jgi:hypothetical protein